MNQNDLELGSKRNTKSRSGSRKNNWNLSELQKRSRNSRDRGKRQHFGPLVRDLIEMQTINDSSAFKSLFSSTRGFKILISQPLDDFAFLLFAVDE